MATNKPQDGYQKQGVRIPKELHALIHEAAAASGRSYNSELIARLQSTFSSLQGSLGGLSMSGQMGAVEAEALTPEQLKLVQAAATEAAKQVVALQAKGVDLVSAGTAGIVQGLPPGPETKPGKKPAPPKKA